MSIDMAVHGCEVVYWNYCRCRLVLSSMSGRMVGGVGGVSYSIQADGNVSVGSNSTRNRICWHHIPLSSTRTIKQSWCDLHTASLAGFDASGQSSMSNLTSESPVRAGR